MNTSHSAIFDTPTAASDAVAALRDAGIPDTSISIIGKDGAPIAADAIKEDDRVLDSDGDERLTTDGEAHAMRGILGGGALGALLAVGAVALPGPGTLVAAGALAAAGSGFLLGGALGGLGEILTQHGIAADDVAFYEERLGDGGVFVSVADDTVGDTARIEDILTSNGGRRAGAAAAMAGSTTMAGTTAA